eukprot:c26780_g1_i1 orf=52-1152(+)
MKICRLVCMLGLAQVASLLVTATGFTSSTLSREGIDAPTFQSFCNYFLVAVVYGCIFLRYKKRFQVTWYYYLLLAFIDVEANYLVVKAYQYTSLTSVMLLDCWTIPCVLFLTWFFLKTKYKIPQFFGVFICIVGLSLVVLSDVHAKDRSGGSEPVKGDMLVIFGSMLYAISNVSEEFLMKESGFVELMAFFGSFGALISACQFSILERHQLQSIHWDARTVLPFVGYGVSMFLFYSIVPFILKVSGSAMFNLSLLTSDMWAVVIRIFVYHQKVDWLYFLSFATVSVGILVYTISGHDKEPLTADTLRNTLFGNIAHNLINNGDELEGQELVPSRCNNSNDKIDSGSIQAPHSFHKNDTEPKRTTDL